MTNHPTTPDPRREFLLSLMAGLATAAGGITLTGVANAKIAGTPGQVFTGNTHAPEWVPFKFTQDGALHAFGEMVSFRSIGSVGNGLAVGLWRAPDGDTPIYTSEAGDETFLVLEGEVTIDFLDLKQSKTFRVGDVCAWSQGSRTLWHMKGGFKKFYVVANARIA